MNEAQVGYNENWPRAKLQITSIKIKDIWGKKRTQNTRNLHGHLLDLMVLHELSQRCLWSGRVQLL